jgi:hypothetical protein
MPTSETIQIIERVVAGVLAALFLLAAAVQLNDADPVLWVTVYGGAALMCAFTAIAGYLPDGVGVPALAAVVVGASYLGWQIFVVGDVTPMYEQASGSEPGLLDTEEGREMLGLVLVAVGLGLAVLLTHDPEDGE